MPSGFLIVCFGARGAGAALASREMPRMSLMSPIGAGLRGRGGCVGGRGADAVLAETAQEAVAARAAAKLSCPPRARGA
eukprot:2658893-Prymnesium_polylepis.1